MFNGYQLQKNIIENLQSVISDLTIELERLKKSKQITLRDQFAMAALHVPFIRSAVCEEETFNAIAKNSYKLADAMLAEREKKC